MSTKAVLITGACGGIGSAMTKAFAKAGWEVISTDEKSGPGIIVEDIGLFASDPARINGFAEKVREALKGAKLSCLINNAAVQHLGRLDTLESDLISETFNVNVIAPMLLTKAFLPELEATNGIVINIGSVHAQSTKPAFSAYATSKAALHGLTRALAVDLGPKVRVNTLAPAATATKMLRAGFEGREDAMKELEQAHPLRRLAVPEEIARIALFLAAEDAMFMTGSTVYADGGVLSRLHDPA